MIIFATNTFWNGICYPSSQLAINAFVRKILRYNFMFSYSQIHRKSHSTWINCSSIFYSHAHKSKYSVKDTFYKCNVEEKYIHKFYFYQSSNRKITSNIHNKKFDNYITAHNLKFEKCIPELCNNQLIQTSTSLGAHLLSEFNPEQIPTRCAELLLPYLIILVIRISFIKCN